MLKDLPLRSDHTGFLAGDGHPLAKFPDDFICLGKFIPWHSREKMMCDLIVKSPIKPGNNFFWHIPAASNISRGKHLTTQKAHIAIIIINYEHSLVIGRKYCSKVCAKGRMMHNDKQYSEHWGKQVKQRAKVNYEMGRHQQGFNPRISYLWPILEKKYYGS